jgi:hypothetical protein
MRTALKRIAIGGGTLLALAVLFPAVSGLGLVLGGLLAASMVRKSATDQQKTLDRIHELTSDGHTKTSLFSKLKSGPGKLLHAMTPTGRLERQTQKMEARTERFKQKMDKVRNKYDEKTHKAQARSDLQEQYLRAIRAPIPQTDQEIKALQRKTLDLTTQFHIASMNKQMKVITKENEMADVRNDHPHITHVPGVTSAIRIARKLKGP